MITYNLAPLAFDVHRHALKLKEHFILQLERREKSAPDPLHAGIEHCTREMALAEEMGGREAAILANEHLSDKGRRERMRELTEEYRDKPKLTKAAKDMRAAAAKLEKELMDVPKGVADPSVDYLIGREIRDRLAKLPVLERRTVLQAATPTTQARIIRAIQSDPLATEWIEAEQVQRIQQQLAQAPDGGRQWNRMETLIFVAEGLEQLAAVVLAKLSGYDEIPSFQGIPTRESEMVFENTQAAPAKNPAIDQPPAGGITSLK